MTKTWVLMFAVLGWLGHGPSAHAQNAVEWQIEATSDEGTAFFSTKTNIAWVKGGARVMFGNALLTADSAVVNTDTGEVTADGKVRIEREDQIYVGEHILYNFKTRHMQAEQFRTGKFPVFAYGEGLQGGGQSNVNYLIATNAFITPDDISEPIFKIRAKWIKIIPGERIEARNATLYLGDVPVFYFPFYSRNLGARANNFNFVPGYRSTFGPFLLSSYQWFLNREL